MIAEHGALLAGPAQGAGSAQLLDSNEKPQSSSADLWSRIHVLLSLVPLLQRILGRVGLLRNYVLKG